MLAAGVFLVLLGAIPGGTTVPPRPVRVAPAAPASPAPYCSGEYADDLVALTPAAREFDEKQAPFTFCIRSSATYECPSYAKDGTLRRTRKKVTAHGTGFAFRPSSGEPVVVTNEHVSEWPAVTDEDEPVEGVPAGCKRVATSLRIVDDESDTYERDDIPLSRVVSDAQLDVSLLRAGAPLAALPWKLGHSAALRERNVVDVRGFPLGVLRAHNVGKVVSTLDRDEANGWAHDDFVIDAPLAPGNSGSPVLAVSCRTGELELVGIYHARYVEGGALHEVIAIDQLRDLLTSGKKVARASADARAALDGSARQRLAAAAAAELEPFFAFGAVSAAVRSRSDGALLFEIFSKQWPVAPQPALVLEDLPAGSTFGHLGRVWAGNRQGLREVPAPSVDPDLHAQLTKALDALRHDALASFDYRAASKAANRSRDEFQRAKRMERELRAAAASRQDLVQGLLEASEALCPRFADATSTVADALTSPGPPSPALRPPERETWRPVRFEAAPPPRTAAVTPSAPPVFLDGTAP